MKPKVHKEKSQAIVYDAERMDLPGAEHFDAGYWAARNMVSGQATGRGSAWFIDAPFGPVVLRRYLRGGWAAKLSSEHYFFSTVSRSRPFREFEVLRLLHELDLPVPRPLAAMCEHHGILSSGAIMTERIEGAQTLADVMCGALAGAELWSDVGKTIRRFHAAGLWHADLNARNILLDKESAVYLIDFDRARFTPGKAVDGKNNLSRLHRSLVKFWPTSRTSELQQAWAQLLAAYHG